MARILYLVHRLPYPPDKGDKVRSFHLLKHLVDAGHEVFLGTFVDDPADARHVPTLRQWCADVLAVPLAPRAARLRSLAGLLRGEALTLAYYRSARLARWVERTVAERGIDAAVVFSSSMAQYVVPRAGTRTDLPVVVDFVDVDSAKWTQYAGARRGPLAWLYRREGERLLAYEREVAARARRAFFVTEGEVALFRRLAPESTACTEPMNNGVDADFFAPQAASASPFPAGEPALVFTGAMDYWPNVDAVTWFAREVLPLLVKDWPRLRFHIVGRNPSPAVLALRGERVVVHGTVADVRPYLQHAAVAVAPLRVARGIQNKVLEAMAMGRAVVASAECAQGIDARAGAELLAAADAAAFAAEVDGLLRAPERAAALGEAARRRVVQRYSWAAHLSGIDRHLLSAAAGGGK